jgi:hypothetical protein
MFKKSHVSAGLLAVDDMDRSLYDLAFLFQQTPTITNRHPVGGSRLV